MAVAVSNWTGGLRMAVVPRFELLFTLEQIRTQAGKVDHAEVRQPHARDGAVIHPVDGLFDGYAAHFGKGLHAAQVQAVVGLAHRVDSFSSSCVVRRATLTMTCLPTLCDGRGPLPIQPQTPLFVPA